MEGYDRRKAYDEKNKMVSKSYKLPQQTVIRFAEACKKKGESQSARLVRLMESYITRTDYED